MAFETFILIYMINIYAYQLLFITYFTYCYIKIKVFGGETYIMLLTSGV